LIRAAEVGVLGIVTHSSPSFGVERASTAGKLMPPSDESEIFTFAVETGGAAVPATFHVTRNREFPGMLTGALGSVTRNGPANVDVVTSVVSVLAPPPPCGCRSRRPERHGPA
jgi:hypothetical protein